MPKTLDAKELRAKIKERKAELKEQKTIVTNYLNGKSNDSKAARSAFSTFVKVNNAIVALTAKLEEKK